MSTMRRLPFLILAPVAIATAAAALAQEPVSALKGHNSNAPIDSPNAVFIRHPDLGRY